jgi:lactoylglutathione lyase
MKFKLLSIATLALTASFVLPKMQEEQEHFSSATLDLGVVVSDIEASAHFYGEILGLHEAKGFSVGEDLCRDAGLTAGKPLDIRVFTLGESASASKVKLMELKDTESKASDNRFVHSQLGLSYMTLMVSDMTAALARIEQAGLKPLADCPVPLGSGAGAPQLTLVRDPDGNLIELIGPLL